MILKTCFDCFGWFDFPLSVEKVFNQNIVNRYQIILFIF
ncbi:hypothetical protein THERMOT_485 [Bathymodiolus thermophilus thioautotrophic gill symbiont]|nr:hypothetical protein THERMOT_485 [Bathymodiolus thermophilus thioautotrophic gill symbiont]